LVRRRREIRRPGNSTVKTWLPTLRVNTLFNQWLTFCSASLTVTYVTDAQCTEQKAFRKMATDLEGKVAFITIHPTGVLSVEAGSPELAQMQNALPVEILTPDDIADAEWLVSDRAKYVTGIQLSVDAGFTVR
jgi:hypothetical protein